MKGKLFDNLGVKVGSAVLALLIWFHVATEKVYENVYRVSIILENVPQDLIMIDATAKEAEIRVKDKGKWLIKLYFEDVTVSVDASEAQIGEFNRQLQPLDVKFAEGQLPQVVEILSPRSVVFYFDEFIRKEVPIVSQVEVISADGFVQVGEISFSPGKVLLLGPKEFLGKVSSVKTKPERITGLTTSLTKIVDLMRPDDGDVEVLPQQVSLFIDVQKDTLRTVTGVPVTMVNVPRGTQAKVKPESISLTVAGGKKVLAQLVPDDFQVTVDFQRARREDQNEVRAKIVYPPSVRLVDAKPNYFQIEP